MPYPLKDKLVVAVTSRALFDLEKEHAIYVEKGLDCFLSRQQEAFASNEPVERGPAFNLVKKLLLLRGTMKGDRPVEVVLVSKNHPHATPRLLAAIEECDLGIERMSFTGGASVVGYLRAWHCDLFLSTQKDDVDEVAASMCCAAALVVCIPCTQSPSQQSTENPNGNGDGGNQYDEKEEGRKKMTTKPQRNTDQILRIAVDGDAVMFDGSAQKVYDDSGLHTFLASEKKKADQPLGKGPFWSFIAKLVAMRGKNPDRIRVALVTARQAPAHTRVLRTLLKAKVPIDEAHFVGGVDKTSFLTAFEADIFFDDGKDHVNRASAANIASALVPLQGVTHSNR